MTADAHAHAPPPGKQGRGRRLTDRERMEIIDLTRADPRLKHVALAARYGVNESTIRKWRRTAHSARVEARYHAGVASVRDLRQRAQAVRNASFDAVVLEWVRTQRTACGELPPAVVRAKARELAAAFDDMRGFKASSGWYYRFCRRYGLPNAGGDTQSSAASTATAAVAVVDATPVCVVSAPEVDEEVEDEGSEGPGDGNAFELAEEEEEVSEHLGSASESVAEVIFPVAGKRKFDDVADNTIEHEAEFDSAARARTEPALLTTPLTTTSQALDAPSTPAASVTQATDTVATLAIAEAAPSIHFAALAPPTTPAPAQEALQPASATPAASEKPAAMAASEIPASSATITTIATPATSITPMTQAEPATPVAPSTPATLATPVTPMTPATPAAPATPSTMSSPPLASPPMSTRQEAISHFLRHHKSLLSLSCRLRFIKHLAHTNEDAEMYMVMDDETRVEYIKEFAEG